MSLGWKWDFEERPRTARKPPPMAPESSDASRTQVRRRRAGVALGLLGLALFVLAVTGALSETGRKSASASSALNAGSPSARAAGADAALGGRSGHTSTGGPGRSNTAPDKAVAGVLAYTPFVRAGGWHGHDIALTFDDGPGPYTPGVLGVLEHFGAPATFFAIGAMERYFSASTVRELRDGDVVGDHTETHPPLARLSAHEQHEQLFEQIARIELLGGPRPRLFRPPYGSFNATTMRELKALRLLMVLWSVDTNDYLKPGVSAIVDRALAGARPGAILLMHDGGGNRAETIAALPRIIKGLRARRYDLVTVPQLLSDDPPPAGLPLPPNLSGD